MEGSEFVFNGVDASSGEYLLAPVSAEALSRAIRGKGAADSPPAPVPGDLKDELEWRRFAASEPDFAPEEGVDPKELAQTGWGVIFSANADGTVRDALKTLLEHRKAQAGDLYREFAGGDGYRPGDTKKAFLSRHGASSGWVKPELMPYYLLIAGSPEEIPYAFQYQLDVQHAVGRVWFDTTEEYARYARGVVAAETGTAKEAKAIFAGVRNTDDPATTLSADELVIPLAAHVQADKAAWSVTPVVGADATKSRLLGMLGGTETPALLFTASHGVGFPSGDTKQLAHQGALLCQDWPGPKQHRGEIPRDFYLSAEDIADDANVAGLLSFHFACYGAGTPRLDDYPRATDQERKAIAPQAFVAGLPRRLLGHPKGGALAAVGHVDRAWGCSFRSGNERQLVAFESMLKRLMEGHPVGSAMEAFNGYFGEMATDLTATLEEAKWAAESAIDHLGLVNLWTRHNDARAYAIVGDPAVRLKVTADVTPDGVERAEFVIRAKTGTPAHAPASADAPATAPSPDPLPAQGSPAAVPPATSSASTTTNIRTSASAQMSAALEIRVDVDERPPAAFGPSGEFQDFGARETAESVVAALSDLVASVGRAVQSAVSDATSLRVVTYTSPDLETVTLDRETGRMAGSAQMRAVTRLSIDGDTLLCLPETDGEVDERIWAIHSEAVKHAQAFRAELLKSVLDAAAGLLPSLK